MKQFATAFALVILLLAASPAVAQFPSATEEHKVLKHEVGEWQAEVTMFMGPAGPYDPPHKSVAKESCRMVGDFWLVSDFEGSFEGMKLSGHAQFGYDPQKKKYFGTWVDSFRPVQTHMIGTFDAATKTLTYDTTAKAMDGTEEKGKNVIVFSDNKKVMTMYGAAPGTGEMIKVMEVVYTRAK